MLCDTGTTYDMLIHSNACLYLKYFSFFRRVTEPISGRMAGRQNGHQPTRPWPRAAISERGQEHHSTAQPEWLLELCSWINFVYWYFGYFNRYFLYVKENLLSHFCYFIGDWYLHWPLNSFYDLRIITKNLLYLLILTTILEYLL